MAPDSPTWKRRSTLERAPCYKGYRCYRKKGTLLPTAPNGRRATQYAAFYTYNRKDKPSQILDRYGTTKELDLNYTYDGTGNVLTENSQSYGYDWMNRLTSSSGPWGSITYSYDSVGNRVQMINGSTRTDYTYGSFNRLTSAGNVNYTYNANGDTITKSGGWTYSYDYENRLTSVIHNGAMVQTNTYDGDGNRVTQTTKGGSVVYSYQGVNILYQKNLTSDTTTKSFYAGSLQVAQMVNYTTYYLHQDALGSTRLVTNGALLAFSSNFEAYGMDYAMSGSEEYQYTGKLLDIVDGLYYEGARYYDPTTGRFITEDSVVGTTTGPMSLNRYIYARDNPMKIVDMNGHEWWNPVADLTTAASAVTSAASSVVSTVSTGVSDVAGAATDVANAASSAWNSLPPAASTTVQSIGNLDQSSANLVQSTLTQVSQSISPSLGSLSDAASRTAGAITAYASSTVTKTVSTVTSSWSQASNCLSHECGATLVTGIMVDVSVGLTLATAAAVVSDTLFPPGDSLTVPVTLGLGTATAVSWDATVEMAAYDYQYGSSATPQGALEHGGQGILQAIDWLARYVS